MSPVTSQIYVHQSSHFQTEIVPDMVISAWWINQAVYCCIKKLKKKTKNKTNKNGGLLHKRGLTNSEFNSKYFREMEVFCAHTVNLNTAPTHGQLQAVFFRLQSQEESSNPISLHVRFHPRPLPPTTCASAHVSLPVSEGKRLFFLEAVKDKTVGGWPAN